MHENRSAAVAAALGQRAFDLVIANVRLVNVYTGEVYPADIGVAGGLIAYVGPAGAEALAAAETRDGAGRWAVPGFIDNHNHLESTMMVPAHYTEVVLPHGTTTSVIDPHEVANVCGLRGVEYVLAASADVPMRILVVAPSCVPSVPGKEVAGADIGPAEMETMLGWDRVIGVAEVMDFPGVLNQDPRMTGIVAAGLNRNQVIQGHFPLGMGRQLNAYVAAGPESDHETTIGEEAMQKLRAGMYVLARESSISQDLHAIIGAVKQLPGVPVNLTFCTDDRHPSDLLKQGHMDHVVRRAIEEGLDPVAAIRGATLVAAQHNRLFDRGAIAPGKLADILLLSDLQTVQVDEVYVGGRLVAKGGRMAVEVPRRRFAIEEENMVKLPRPLTAADFTIQMPVQAGTVRARAMHLPAVTPIITELAEFDLPVRDGAPDLAAAPDVCLISVAERHGRTRHNLAVTFLTGYGLRSGAIGCTVAHDSHNLLLVGRSPADMAVAAAELARVGGGIIAVENGQVRARVDLPIMGLLSPLPARELAPLVERLKATMMEMGVRGPDPVLLTTIFALAVIPRARITDLGLIDVVSQEILPTLVG